MKDDNKLIIDTGLLFQANRMVFNLFGISLCYKVVDGKTELFVKDSRDEPEKAIFSREVLEAGAEKYEKFSLAEGHELMRKRQNKLGYSVQPWIRKINK